MLGSSQPVEDVEDGDGEGDNRILSDPTGAEPELEEITCSYSPAARASVKACVWKITQRDLFDRKASKKLSVLETDAPGTGFLPEILDNDEQLETPLSDSQELRSTSMSLLETDYDDDDDGEENEEGEEDADDFEDEAILSTGSSIRFNDHIHRYHAHDFDLEEGFHERSDGILDFNSDPPIQEAHESAENTIANSLDQEDNHTSTAEMRSGSELEQYPSSPFSF